MYVHKRIITFAFTREKFEKKNKKTKKQKTKKQISWFYFILVKMWKFMLQFFLINGMRNEYSNELYYYLRN